MSSLASVANEIRCRFQAAATNGVVYREAPTVGSDRDIVSFFLEWQSNGTDLDAVAVHVDFLNGRIASYPDVGSVHPRSVADGWLDALLDNLPTRFP